MSDHTRATDFSGSVRPSVGVTFPGTEPTKLDYEAWTLRVIDGIATSEETTALQNNPHLWIASLRTLVKQTDRTLDRVRSTVHGPERSLVLNDFEDLRTALSRELSNLVGEDEPSTPEKPQERELDPPGETALQLTWDNGSIVAWAAGNQADRATVEELTERLADLGGGSIPWSPHAGLPLPDGTHCPAVTVHLAEALGWLLSLRTSHTDDRVAPSTTWLALTAALGLRLVAQGRMLPQLERITNSPKPGPGRDHYRIAWLPALVDSAEFTALCDSMPGAVSALTKSNDRRQLTDSLLRSVVDTIVTDAARRVDVPAAPPRPRSATEVAEAVLASLGGNTFDAPTQRGNEVAKGMYTWAKHLLGQSGLSLIVQLAPPDEGNAWHLRTLVPAKGGRTEHVDAAMSNASQNRREQIKAELDRLESVYMPLERGKAERRGEVILSQDEAWDLMTETGPILAAAGYDVRVPPLSRKKPKPGLKLTSANDEGATSVGAQQLTFVKWSAVFGDVELTAKEIMELSAESRPMVKSGDRWIALDKADLDAAAEALAERADQTQMSGAEMLRHAMGLEHTSLGGPVALEGEGWASELLHSAKSIPAQPPTRPSGFNGELRGYQADALAWLEFLTNAGLGGILALDMGLGKTPTMLAHLARPDMRKVGPALVIAPPAVVGNWAAEARKFVPGVRVKVHHGQNRPGPIQFAKHLDDYDVFITTYGTGLRDVSFLDEVSWSTIVLDEGQAIKNPNSETAQQLRRLNARSRVILTGTPIENGLGDLWALLDFTNPGLAGDRATFINQLSRTADGKSTAEEALRTLNGVLVYRRTKAEPAIAAELPDRIDTIDYCTMTPEQIGLYQAVLDQLMQETAEDDRTKKRGAVLGAITALKQICNHPANYLDGNEHEIAGRSGKLERLEAIVENVFDAEERVLIFTHFATWGTTLAKYLTDKYSVPIECYHGGLARGRRDQIIKEFQNGKGKGALVLSLKAGGTGLNLTAASHVVLYDRWWNPAVEDQARDRAWRIGQTRTVFAHRLVCPGTVDERVEEVVAGKRRIADMVLPKSSSVGDLDSDQLRIALGIDESQLLTAEDETTQVVMQ